MESRGDSRLVLGPVAFDLIKERLAAALLGVRPTLKRKQARTFERIEGVKKPTPVLATKPNEQNHKNEELQLDGLASLRLSTRVTMILHSLHIRSLQDLRTADEKVLGRYLARLEIEALKKMSALAMP